MSGRRKGGREKDLTQQYLSGGFEEDRVDKEQRFTTKSKKHQESKTRKTTLMREGEGDVEGLPVGEVVQVFSLYSEVEHEGKKCLCVVKKTLSKVSHTQLVVGDRVRFRAITDNEPEVPTLASLGSSTVKPEGVIEQVLPRETVVTRAESFKQLEQHPIVANAGQMLIVAALAYPAVKWGLVDRMLIAAEAGKLAPILCLNKADLAAEEPKLAEEYQLSQEVLAHYRSLGVRTLQTSVTTGQGIEELREVLRGQTTVLAGHSGVGKSSLVRAVQPSLDLRVGEISRYTMKGKHTTTSARRYALDVGGFVVDTPGVKLFGLWGVTRENVDDFFPDVVAGTAPEWRRESYERIKASLPQQAWE